MGNNGAFNWGYGAWLEGLPERIDWDHVYDCWCWACRLTRLFRSVYERGKPQSTSRRWVALAKNGYDEVVVIE